MREPAKRRLARPGAWILAALLGCLGCAIGSLSGGQERPAGPVAADAAAGRALVERLREGGLVVYFRHADTTGMACDRSYRIGDRPGQRNISPEGREQARRIGQAVRELEIPVHEPVLAGPVFRARDTAELAFGPERVEITDSLLADDYAGSRVRWVIAEHRRLLSEPVEAGANRILVGHRTPGLLALEDRIAPGDFPEGAALIIEPRDGSARLLGVLSLAPLPGAVGDRC